MKLDKQQFKAVTTEANKVLVVAGAGSGKTRVLTERVRHLIDKGVEPQNIVCITFTNMASQEMKLRLSDIPVIGDAFIGTIHSFANTIYRGSGLQYQILTSEVEVGIYKELLTRVIGKPMEFELSFKRLMQYFDMQTLYEQGKISEEELSGFLYPSEQEELKELKNRMHEICKQRNIITFNELLKKSKEYYHNIGGRIEYVLVDEFQDVGRLEAEFVLSLNADNYFFVGDDWQSIYGFKGGDVQIFKNLIKSGEYEVIYLENNYRNGSKIISTATKIISQVSNKIDKKVNIMSNVVGNVTVNTKNKIREYIRQIKKSGNFKDWFILTRTNKEVVEISELLEEMDVPYMSFKRAGMSFDQMTELMQEDTVKLLTVHVSKGLENRNVILYGHFPIKCPPYMLDEEERKVMYVGVTRASENLVILN